MLEQGTALAEAENVDFADRDKISDRLKIVARCKLLSNDSQVRPFKDLGFRFRRCCAPLAQSVER